MSGDKVSALTDCSMRHPKKDQVMQDEMYGCTELYTEMGARALGIFASEATIRRTRRRTLFG
eukprot:scaffold7821_cov277-Pinguiococcus_pyrenoidosus.AAC.2